MGIPRLTGLLESLAVRTELRGRVVIDGPALAYHVLNTYKREGTVDPLDEPYTVLGQICLEFLDALESYGVTVSAIYFDGRLPRYKVGERMTRVSDASRVVNNYFIATSKGIPTRKPAGQTTKASSAGRPVVKSSSTVKGGTPVPPFLVPSILEVLRGSERYAAVTYVVPGEADPFCAADVKRKGGTVLTSDSDLLLHDVGSDGAVVFFRDLDTVEVARAASATDATQDPGARPKSIIGLRHTRKHICESLSIPVDQGLFSLAFEILMDYQASLRVLVGRSLKHEAASSYPEDYTRLLLQYRNIPGCELWAASPSLVSLDPRLSELVLQCTQEADSSRNEHEDEAPEVMMFLPLLLERYDQATAWEASVSTRRLAYGVLRLLPIADVRTVAEYRRTQSKASKGRAVEVPSPDELPGLSSDYIEKLEKVQTEAAPPELRWTIWSMAQEIRQSHEDGKESMVLKLWKQASKASGKLDPTSWDVAHLAAQLQGALYSLRMLRQVLVYTEQETVDVLPGHLARLKHQLSSLPAISSFPSIRDTGCVFVNLKNAGCLALLTEAAGLSEPIPLDGASGRKTKRKREGREGATSNQASRSRTTTSQNPYDVLSTASGGG